MRDMGIKSTPSNGNTAPADACSASLTDPMGMASSATPAIDVRHVSKSFGSRHALDDISFQLPAGSFLSIFGPNGAGKTTLLRIISTLARPTRGDVYIEGIKATEHPERVRAHIGLISHQSMLYDDLTAAENLMIAARLYGVENPEKRVSQMLDAVELSHRSMDVVRTFSCGMTQRISIARALIADPDVVLLDEPYAGLDPHAVDVFDQLIAKVRHNRTFIMVSHDMDKGLAVCSHVLVMARGRRAAFAKKDEIDRVKFASFYSEIVGMGVA